VLLRRIGVCSLDFGGWSSEIIVGHAVRSNLSVRSAPSCSLSVHESVKWTLRQDQTEYARPYLTVRGSIFQLSEDEGARGRAILTHEKWNGTCCHHPQLIENMVSAAGLEPATHALKGAPTQLQTTTCTSSLLHTRRNKISEIRIRHRPGCPEGAQRATSHEPATTPAYSRGSW
jgi:hypothetical protein